MLVLVAIVIGVLFATGISLLFRRSITHLIIGLALLGHATNLFLFTMGGLRHGKVPLIGVAPTSEMVDPLPQALILTAIVIGFGIQAFLLGLGYRAHEEASTDSLDEMESGDRS